MIALPNAIEKYFGTNVLLSSEVTSVDKNEIGFSVSYQQNGVKTKINCDAVLINHSFLHSKCILYKV